MDTYKIVRFYAQEGKKRKLIKTGLTLEEAQEHCSQESTHKLGVWFDGYVKENTRE
jgi:hypothetical protein